MRQVKIEHGNIFELTDKAFKDGQRIIFHKGGTGSGKTFDLMIYIVIMQAMTYPNKVLTVVSESFPHLEIGVIRIFETFMKEAGLFDPDRFKAKRIYAFPNDSVIEFFSADRIGKALGARRYLLYGNEINSLKFQVWDELSRRSEVVIGDFNPTAEFWLEKFIEFYGGTVIKSNYTFNPFLPAHERHRIEKRAEMDENFKRIHVDAEYGNYEGLVYPGFEQMQLPQGANLLGYGLDFGYSNDPSALVGIYKHRDSYYVDEIFYQTGLMGQDMIRLMKQMGVNKNKYIYADSADPRLIREIGLGGFNCKGVKKEKLYTSIEFTKKYFKFVTPGSTNLVKELRNYMYIMKNDKYTNEPMDAFNHAIDAMRYGFLGLFGRSKLQFI